MSDDAITGRPSRVVACEVPPTPESRAAIERVFHAYSGLGVARVTGAPAAISADDSVPPRLVPAPGAPANAEESPCPPEAIYCDPGTGEWAGGYPGEYLGYAASLTEAAPATEVCWGQLDYIHNSSHVRGTVNVEGRTVCPTEQSMYVVILLKRQVCIWFFCWFNLEDVGPSPTLYARRVDANAAAACKQGYWYIADGWHGVFFSSGLVTANTGRAFYAWYC